MVGMTIFGACSNIEVALRQGMCTGLRSFNILFVVVHNLVSCMVSFGR